MTGLTMNSIYKIPDKNILTIHLPSDRNVILLQINNNGEIYYRYNDEMVRVNCPDDIVEAFSYTILNYTNSSIEDVLFNKYINKISNNNINNEQLILLEQAFRKIKMDRINDKNR